MIKRIITMIKGWLSIKTQKIEEVNLDLLIENLSEQKSKAIMDIFNKLVDIDTSIKQLKRTRDNIASKVKDYEELTKKAVSAGNESEAANYAFEYKNYKAQLEQLEAGIAKAESCYNELTNKQSDVISQFDQRISDIKIKMTNYKISEQLNSITKLSDIKHDSSFENNITRVGNIIDKKNDRLESEVTVADVLNLSDKGCASVNFDECRKSALDEFKQSHSVQ